jgi:hypothetical protein
MIYRKTPYLVPGTTLIFKKKLLRLVPDTKCSQKNFENFFRDKNKAFGPVQIPKKTFLSSDIAQLVGAFDFDAKVSEIDPR